jgi:4-diphosphocytidyl-2-C-methyl-D-erythritol kinase
VGDADAIRAAGRYRRVSELSPRRVEIDAPAKLNLGLEVIGRREDGFHEIATIFLAIDLVDRLRLTLTPNPSPIAMGEGGSSAAAMAGEPATGDGQFELRCDNPALSGSDNLTIRALKALNAKTPLPGPVQIDLQKRIPAAAGLGGASSDAAATLLAARELWQLSVTDESLHRIAAGLGSDVPFFLSGGCALGRGRGEILESLPVPEDLWFVLVVPKIVLPNKTASLYARLGEEDFSDGERVATQAGRIAARLPLDPALLGNVFAGPLYSLAPHLARLPGVMRDAGAGVVAISGAGPTHYAPFTDPERAELVAARLRQAPGNDDRVILAGPVAERPPVSPSL